MRTYQSATTERKTLVNRINELTGEKLTYTGTSGFRYEGFGFTVTKEGNLEVDDSADQAVVEALIKEGLIVEQPEPVRLTVAIPTARHNGATLRNLVNLLYTRADLLNKALGTAFRVEEGLTDFLRDGNGLFTAEDFRKMVAEYNDEHGKAIDGLVIEHEKITFSSLPDTADSLTRKTFTDLCVMMNKQALEQNRIQAKTVNDENEKYAMRIWLVRLGMNGPEYKESRKLLMENLSGHSAFRTNEDRQRWLARQEEKREKLNAIKESMRRNNEISE